jgi:hypothetical protein
MAEIRIFHQDRFLCRAVCAELAGEIVPLREILRARNRRRRELRGVLRDRQTAVNTLLAVKRGEITEKNDEPPTPTEELTASKPDPDRKLQARCRKTALMEKRRWPVGCRLDVYATYWEFTKNRHRG